MIANDWSSLGLLLSFIFLSSFSAQAADEHFQSESVTEKGLFTKGIEGPAVDREGNLYVVNFAKEGTIGVKKPGQAPALFLTLPAGSISSSVRFNAQNEMLITDRKRHRILKVHGTTKEISVVAEHPEMNQPNDFAVTKSGELFLSDPSWSSKKKGSIWKVAKEGAMENLATDLKAVNGIDLSPEEDKVYFSESIGGAVWSYDLADGKLTNKKKVYQFKPDTVDGLRVDAAGVIYVARIGEGRIDRLSGSGKLLGSIPTLGKDPTNLAFGGPDGKTVFVTMRDTGSIESFQVPNPGREWDLQRVKARAKSGASSGVN